MHVYLQVYFLTLRYAMQKVKNFHLKLMNLKTGLTPLKSQEIKSYRVKESPIQMECKLIKIVSINGENYGGSYVVFGEIIVTHVRTDLKNNNEKINEQMIQTVSRLGALRYGTGKVANANNTGRTTTLIILIATISSPRVNNSK